MNICYLLESTELCGGVRVVFDQARALQNKGHNVAIRAARGDHSWYPYHLSVEYAADLTMTSRHRNSDPGVVVATFWTTVEAALKIKTAATFHLCQGYEGDLLEYAYLRQDIERAYRASIPKLTIGEWLSKRLREIFGRDTFEIHCIGQIVDLDMYRPLPCWRKWRPSARPHEVRVLVVGLFEASVKAIPDALHAVALLRGRDIPVRLIRVSSSDTLRKECAITPVDEFYAGLSPEEMASMYQRADVFLAPSLSHEGFGLPFAEALACGIPSVATAIPSHISFDKNRDYACFVPEGDPVSMAEAAMKIMNDRTLRNRLRKRGVEVIRRNFRSEFVAERLESVFSEALR